MRRLEAGRVESIILPLLKMIRQNPCSVGGVIIDRNYWYDVGTIDEYNKLKLAGF